MNDDTLRQLVRAVADGAATIEELRAACVIPAETSLAMPEHAATLDLDRQIRCGYGEVVFGPGKSPAALAAIVHAMVERGREVLATRVTPEQVAAVAGDVSHNAVARTLRARPAEWKPASSRGRVAVVTAGTTDLPVAEEARETIDWMGASVTMIHDVGVAGPHRLPSRLAELRSADAIVVVAGMEGALPSVVAGHVAVPIFAVPTSVGYGANFGGLAALLAMLNSCAANVAVVNIDAGFKAGYLAAMVARQVQRRD